MQSCTLQSQLHPDPILYYESAGNASTSSTSSDPSLSNFGPAVVEGLYCFDRIPDAAVLQSNLLSCSAVQPVAQRPIPRASAACDRCRKRKTKCDEGRPQCSSCRENDLTCSYNDSTTRKATDLARIFERFDHLEMIIKLQNNPRSHPPYEIQRQDDDRGSYFRPLDPSYCPHRYIDRDGGREDFIEVLSPELLPWLAKYVDLDHKQMASQSPAFFTACQLKRSLHRYTMDPATTSTDMSLSMMLEIDGILRAQARHNLSRLNTLSSLDVLKRACLALLALHLQKSIGKLGTLSDYRIEADGFVVLKTPSTKSERIDLLRLVQDDSFHFDLHFADTYPSSWFPKARELVTTPQDLGLTLESGKNEGRSVGKVGGIQINVSISSQQVLQRYIQRIHTVWKDGLCKFVEAVGGQRISPLDLLSKENLWKHSLCLRHLSTGSHHSPICNSQHLSEALASINNCLRKSLKETLRNEADTLTVPNITCAFVQPVLDLLALNIGAEISRDTSEGIQTIGHLRHITHYSENMVDLHIHLLDDSWGSIKRPIQQVPFLWGGNGFALNMEEIGIDLPLHWFSNL